jgi:hypothetical protein
LANVVSVAAGYYNTLALRADGTVVAWGNNIMGQCNVPPEATNILAIEASVGWCVALTAEHKVLAWGESLYGKVDFASSLSNIAQISIGPEHCLAVTEQGTVLAGGATNFGACNVPVGLSNVVAVAAGGSHSLALKSDGTVIAWGNNSSGQCNVPVNLPPVSRIATGDQHSLVLLDLAAAPRIFRQPVSQNATIGSTVYFTVSATGPLPLGYQWFMGTNLLVGATNRVLALRTLSADEAGSYTVVVSNNSGSVTSQLALLGVLPGLDIRMIPGILISGTVGKSYRIDFINAVGSTNGWTTLSTVTLTNSPEYYFDVSALGQPSRIYRLIEL